MNSLAKDLLAIAVRLVLTAAVMVGVYFPLVVALHFPYDVGYVELPPLEQGAGAADYYERVYRDSLNNPSDDGHDYVDVNREAAADDGVVAAVEDFVRRYSLENARTLEVGAGSGQLQDVVDDYTGLDIAASASQYFHKPFVQGSALDLPFGDDEFDAAWTVWTLEHVPDPEKSMEELRRVVKPGGMLFFFPAWDCVSWTATGLEVRSYDSLSWTEKVEKASLFVRSNMVFRASYIVPIRLLRYGYARFAEGPTRLRYTALRPNYTHFWGADADAIASIDAVEAMLWFESRGDSCLNCPEGVVGSAFMYAPLHIRLAERADVTPVAQSQDRRR